jgi:metallo-beta-lactamase class B
MSRARTPAAASLAPAAAVLASFFCLRRSLALALVLTLPASAFAQYTRAEAEWNQPVEPFRIAGNLYYVGATNVASYAIATSEGLILVDTGFRETVPIIQRNLQKLGFRLEDVRLLLALHAHYDHVGGVADIKSRTKARFLASPGDAPLFERGGKDDFAFGDRFLYPPVKPDALLSDGEPVGLGGTMLTPHFTPGHTKGATSWTMTVRDGDRDYHVMIASSVSTPDYRLIDNPKYPAIVHDLESSFATLRTLPCDIFLTEHSWQFGLPDKMQRRAADPSHNPFVDPEACRRFIESGEASLHKLVAEQKAQQEKTKQPKSRKQTKTK